MPLLLERCVEIILRVLKGWCRSHILWKRITVLLFFLLQCPPVHHFSLLSSDLDFSNSFALEKMVCPRECKSGSSYVWAKYIPNILPTVSPTERDASWEVPGIVSLKYASIGRIKRIRLQKIKRKQNSDPTTCSWLAQESYFLLYCKISDIPVEFLLGLSSVSTQLY